MRLKTSVVSVSLLLFVLMNVARVQANVLQQQKASSKAARRQTVKNTSSKSVAIAEANSPQKAGTQKTGGAKAAAENFKAEDVKFKGYNLQLAGTLLLPKAEAGARVPAVAIISDMKPATRDGVPAGNGVHTLYRDLAQHLAARGIATLRYDRRCVGASDCKVSTSFDDFIGDGEAVVKFLRSRNEIDPARIVVLGHGEGGLIAAIVASHEETAKTKLAGVIFAATAGRFGSRVVREHIKTMLTEQGKPAAEISAYLKKVDQLIGQINTGISDFSSYKLDPADDADQMLIRLTEDPIYSFGMLTNDPLQTMKSIKVPVLIVQGDKDVITTVSDAEYLEEAFTRDGHPDVTMKVMPNADHVFKVSKEASLKAGNVLNRPLDTATVKLISEWLEKRLAVKVNP